MMSMIVSHHKPCTYVHVMIILMIIILIIIKIIRTMVMMKVLTCLLSFKQSVLKKMDIRYFLY